MAVIAGVDVGGSGLRLKCLYGGQPGQVRTAAGVRVGSGGIDVAALARDARALLDAEGASGRDVADIDVLVWSMRGLLFLADRTEVLRQVQVGLGARQTVVVSDALANLVGALGSLRPGAVVAAGTGAVAFGTDFGEIWRRIDGWGHLLGDRGGAAWVGLEGLRAALREMDGVGRGSGDLLAAGQELFGPVEGWPRRVMTSSAAPDVLAGFARVVTDLTREDVVARGICIAAGEALADSLLSAAEGINGAELTATGGLLASDDVHTALRDHLAEAGRELVEPKGGALDGALVLGGHLLVRDALPAHPSYLLVS